MRKNTVLKYIAFGLISCAISASISSCSNIDEADRLIYVETPAPPDTAVVETTDSIYDAPIGSVVRRVLIEDHTGQKCPNCPDATKLIHEFQQAYGSLIVPVAIHSQQQGIMEPEGLGTELGNNYYKQWGIEFKPAGLVNRLDGGSGKVLDKTIWIYALKAALEMPATIDIRVKAIQEGGNAAVDVKVINTGDNAASGQLMVWLTEDNIVAPQDSMGTQITNYVHNHVLRAAVNDAQGEAVNIEAGAIQEHHYTLPLKAAWKPDNVSIVAFIDNGDEVAQVTQTKLKTNKQ